MPPSLINFKERPVLNSIYYNSMNTPEPRSFDLYTLMYWIKRTPECIGILKRISDDIVTEIYFTPVESKIPSIGRPPKNLSQKNTDKAYEFSRENLFPQKCKANVFDWAALGDFYTWKGSYRNDEIKEISKKYCKEFGIDFKEIELKQAYDEDFTGITSIEIVPSTMVRIKHDKTKIVRYIQKDKNNPGNDIEFYPDEIIHGKFMEVDGSVYGFSPMESSYCTIRTINSIQDYNWYFFENSAKLDRVWKFSGNINPSWITRFEQQLARYKNVKNAHGDIVISGADKIETETLNEISEKMEFRDIMINAAGRLAFAFNMPADILSSILGKDIRSTTGSSDIEDAGYNRNVERAQSYFENIYNEQLWIPHFKVEMHFVRTFMQDKIRHAQYMSQIIPVADWLMKHEYPLSDEYFHDFFQIPRKYLIDGKIKKIVEDISNPQLLPNKQTIKGEASQVYQEEKKKQQEPQSRNNPPAGS